MKSKKIVCFGNSVGVRIRPHEGQCENYADLLSENFYVENYCFTGNMIESVSRNTDKILQKQADIIILQFGVVELSSRSTFLAEYERTVQSLDANSSAQIICLGVNTPSSRVENHLPGTSKRIQSVQLEMKNICEKFESSTFIDVSDIDQSLMPDGIHYSAEGHQSVYGRILKVITT